MAKRLTIAETFADLKQKQQIAMMPFVPAGYPDLQTTAAVLPALAEAGANLIEVGIPFSDPIADGPTVQAAFTAALSKKLRVSDIFKTIASARDSVPIPLVAMVSYSIVHRYGVDHFVRTAKEAGFDGLILPDLPPPEAQAVCRRAQEGGLETTLLVAPTTALERRSEILRLSSGFVYYLSVSGITGERDRLPPDLAANVLQLKQIGDRPICVGFGISRPEHVKELSAVADGAIVGSAVVKQMHNHVAEGSKAIAQACANYCRELLSQVR